MATTQNTYTGNGSTTDYSITFEYLKDADVKVTLDHVATTAFTLPNATTLRFNTAPGNNVAIRIFRDTDVDAARFVYSAGSAIKAAELNENADQSLYALQETVNTDDITDEAVTTAKLRDGAITAAKLGASAIITAKIADGSVTTAKIAADAVNGTKIADDSIDSEHYVDGSIDTAHIADSQVTTEKIADANVTTAKIADNAVIAAKIPDSSLVSAKYAAQSVGTAALADGSVTEPKLATDSVSTTKIVDDAVTMAKLGSGALPTDITVASANIVDGTIATADIAADAITNALIATDAVNADSVQDGTLDSAKLTADTVVTAAEHAASTPDDTSFFTTSASDARYFRQDSTETVTSGVSWTSDDARVATTGAIDARIVDLVEEVGGFVPIANETSFPAANPDVNNGAGTIVSVGSIGTARTPSSGTVTITDGAGTGNDVTITGVGTQVLTAGFGMLVETTTTLHTYTFHRLTPPATNVNTVATNITDVNTVADNDANITTVAGIDSDVTTVANNNANVTTVAGSIANVNTAAGSIANINTVANDLNEATSEIDTVATNITNVNAVGNDITNVNTVASNINSVNSFSDVYRIAASDPTTSLNVGDLVFNTTNNSLRIYNGTSWQDGATAAGNFMSKTGDAMSGNLNMQTNKVENVGDATADGDAVSKSFMDSAIDAALTGDVIGGQSITVTDDSPASGQISIAVTGDSIGATQLANTAVTAGTYGASQNGVASFTVDAQGRLTAASTDTSPTFNGDLTVSGGEGVSAALLLQADQGDDNGDTWRIISNQDDNDLTFSNNVSGSYVDKVTIQNDGDVFLTGDLKLPDSDKAVFGSGNDLQIFHDATDSFVSHEGPGHLYVKTTTNDKDIILQTDNGSGGLSNYVVCDGSAGAVRLYNYGSEKLTTLSSGVDITGELRSDSLDVDGSGDISGNLTLHGNLDLQDNDKILIGSSDDLEIYHDGSSSTIATSTSTPGDLNIIAKGTNNDLYLQAADDIFIRPQNGEKGIVVTGNGPVELYYDNNKRIETTSGGVNVVGSISVNGTVDGRDIQADGSKLDGIESGADVTDATNVNAAGAVMNSDTSTSSMSFVVDEDNMSSNSNTKVPTQQSVKAYVDANAGATSGLFWENGTSLSSSYTVPASTNAMSAGPFTIGSGVAVTIGSGRSWTVV